MTETCCAN